MKDIKALFLAAGDSTRLWPINNKLFVDFVGIPLIQHSINSLKKAGIREIIIIASKNNYLDCQKLISFNQKLSIKVLIQENELGMAGAVLTAEKEIAGGKIVVVGPSDITEDYLIADFKENLKNSPDGMFVGKELEKIGPLGFYSIKDDYISGIIEKPSSKINSKIAALVLDYYKDADGLINAIKNSSSKNDDIYEKAKNLLINEGLRIKLLPYNGYWGYLKYPWHILNISAYFLSKIKAKIKNAVIHDSVKIKGEVYVEDNVTILENVKIVGPVYIGQGVTIGQNSLIRESQIGSGSVIGFSSEVARSYLGANCWLHQNYIGDSVILNGTAFGSGAVTANFRLDGKSIKSSIGGKMIDTGRTKLGTFIGKNSRIGVNSSIMPGVKIGNNTFIGSGITVDKDISDHKFLKMVKVQTQIVDNREILEKGIESNLLNLKY